MGFFMTNFFNRLKNLDVHFKEVLLQSSSTIIIQIVGISARLVTSIIIGRILGASGLGEVNLINQIITIVMVLSMFGMDHVLVKKIAIGNSNNDSIIIGNSIYTALILNVFISILITVIGVYGSSFIASFFNNSELEIPLIISFIVIVPQTISSVFISGINGYRKIWQSRFLKDFLTSLIVLIGIGFYFFLNIEISLISIIFLYALGRIVTFFITTIYWKKLYNPIYKKSFFDRTMLSMAVPLLFVSSTTLLSSSVDVLMLGWLSDSSKVGLYTVASRLVLFIAFFLQITNAAISPKLANFFDKNQLKEMNILVKQVTLWLFIIGFVSMLFFVCFGSAILELWGYEFSAAYICLIILSVGQFINISTGCSGVLLIMGGHEKIFSYISGAFLLLNIILNYLLITKYNEVGAAIATAGTIIGENIIRVVIAKQKTGVLTIPVGLFSNG